MDREELKGMRVPGGTQEFIQIVYPNSLTT